MNISEARLTIETIDTKLVPRPAKVSVLEPPGYDAHRADPYPLILLLHGGNGDQNFLSNQRANIERAWRMGLLPAALVATPNADRSFYMDYRDGSQRWETFITSELLAHLRRSRRIKPERSGLAVAGISMGGMGALRMAFKRPELFAAVAALEPGIEPALAFDDIKPRDRFWRAQDLFEEKYGKPIDGEFWKANNPANIAQRDSARLRDSGLQIYIEVGDLDSFHLHEGAEFLHRMMFDQHIKHEYRLVRGADHLGRSLPERFLDAFRFLGRALDPPPRDESLDEFHRMIAAMKRRAGLGGQVR